ncbi:MAG TPA: hypothetical protein PL110_17205 [Candidatus Eremiobacteraeota bacterium]|nr:hypothetical protein [Candidatus Eremiobacteraeota bacterium]
MNLENIKYLIEVWGPIGLLIANILDSSFISMSGIMDGVFIGLCIEKSLPEVLLNCICATTGSSTGMVIMYFTIRKGKDLFLKDYLEKGFILRFKDLIERYEFFFVIFLCIMPPPFPFKAVLVASILLSKKFSHYLGGVITGRLFRYLFEGLLAWKYGEEIKYIMINHYSYVILGIVILGLLSYLIKRR